MSQRRAATAQWGQRRVVTGDGGPGRSVFLSDGSPEAKRDRAEGSLTLWRLAESPGGDGFAGHGAVTWQIARLPGGTEASSLAPFAQGPNESESLEFNQIFEGQAELVLDQGRTRVGPGDAIVRRGSAQRWRVLGDRPLVCSSIVLEPRESGDSRGTLPPGLGARERKAPEDESPRRIVTGISSDGRSCIESVGGVPNAFHFEHGGGMAYADLWQTMGNLDSAAVGGDAPDDSIQLLPHGDGIAWKRLVVPAESVRMKLDRAKLAEERRRRAAGLSRGGQRDPDQPGRHRTDTVDLVQILEGQLRLNLDPRNHVDLVAGDCVVQQGSWHTWTNHGQVPCVFDVVMMTTAPR